MNPVSASPAIIAIAVAIATSSMLKKRSREPLPKQRFATIDGLRGFLAYCVFLHHSSIWYFYLRTGRWEPPPSNLYTHFGQSAVALFFMITGFLFFSKLIDERSKKIDWGRLYVSRLLRLLPLYSFVMTLLFAIIFFISKGVAKESTSKLLTEAARWLSFTLLGSPNINGIENTGIIVAGVTWSLPFEWIFYLSLPVLSLSVKAPPPFRYLALGTLSITIMIIRPNFDYLIFLGGILAAILIRFEWIYRTARHKYLSYVALLFLFAAIFGSPTAYQPIPILLLTAFFVIIASGNSLFGILNATPSRTLGEFAYGIYLIHGIFLYVTFNFILGLPYSRTLSAVEHWAVVTAITPLLIFTCFLTFRFIETPAMQQTTKTISSIRSFLSRIRG